MFRASSHRFDQILSNSLKVSFQYNACQVPSSTTANLHEHVVKIVGNASGWFLLSWFAVDAVLFRGQQVI